MHVSWLKQLPQIVGYCFAAFFLPLGILLLPIDLLDGKSRGIGFLGLGCIGYALAAKSVGAKKLLYLVVLLTSGFGTVFLARAAWECGTEVLRLSCAREGLELRRFAILGGTVLLATVAAFLIRLSVDRAGPTDP